jgi:hypothetical protein
MKKKCRNGLINMIYLKNNSNSQKKERVGIAIQNKRNLQSQKESRKNKKRKREIRRMKKENQRIKSDDT